MKNILCVTYPRSGHHLLVNMLLKYFSRDIEYPDTDDSRISPNGVNDEVITAGGFNYCEFYGHCNSVPCSDPRTNFQKNHDFELRLRKDRNRKHIVQYRHPLNALISLYEARLETRASAGIQCEDSSREWLDFIGCCQLKDALGAWSRMRYRKVPGRILYWKLFSRKWILNGDLPDACHLSYERLTEQPARALAEVIAFIDPDENPDLDLIGEITARQNVHCGRNTRETLSAFRHYDEDFFCRIEESVAAELQALGMARIAG